MKILNLIFFISWVLMLVAMGVQIYKWYVTNRKLDELISITSTKELKDVELIPDVYSHIDVEHLKLEYRDGSTYTAKNEESLRIR